MVLERGVRWFGYHIEAEIQSRRMAWPLGSIRHAPPSRAQVSGTAVSGI